MKSCKCSSCKTCKILLYILHISCKFCTINEAFLARYEKFCQNLKRKNCKIISCKIWSKSCKKSFLQDSCKIFHILQEKLPFRCKTLQDSCKIFHISQEKLHFWCMTCKILCKILQVLQEKYFQDINISCKTVFTGIYQANHALVLMV